MLIRNVNLKTKFPKQDFSKYTIQVFIDVGQVTGCCYLQTDMMTLTGSSSL